MSGPDFTDAVMRRLGLERVSPAEARRRRARRAAARLAVCAAVLVTGAVAVRLLDPASPPPPGPTIPDAVEHDLDLHGGAVDRAWGHIRDLSGELSPPPDRNRAAEEPVEGSGDAPRA